MNTTVQNAIIAADRLFEIMDLEREAESKTKLDLKTENFGDIVLKDVSFRYGSRKDIFENLNLTIEKEKFTVLTGESGSGKSTIINLLQNIYSIKNGSIHFGTINLSYIRLKSLRDFVAGIPQHIDLFKSSLIENIALGDYEPNVHRIMTIANDFGFNDFIKNLPNGLESYVEEKGVNFSGGEKQKIGILRVFYKNPKVVILDETTSAMDNISEKKVLDALLSYSKKGTTILFVTHRTSVMKMADKISFLQIKTIVEEGKYTNLLENRKEFYKFILNIN